MDSNSLLRPGKSGRGTENKEQQRELEIVNKERNARIVRKMKAKKKSNRTIANLYCGDKREEQQLGKFGVYTMGVL